MKKLFVLLTIMLFQTFAFGQVHELFFGIAPYGHWGLRESTSNVDLLSNSYLISRPGIHLGYSWRGIDADILIDLLDNSEVLVDLFYAKESLIDQAGQFSMENSHLAMHAYLGYTFFNGRRVQLPLYLGLGLSHYSQPVPTKLLIDMGGRARIRIYVTNTIAMYVGGYYLIGLNGKKEYKDNKVHHSGLETGVLFNF